jgi:hypothetical protein
LNKLTKSVVLFLSLVAIACFSIACAPNGKPNDEETVHTHEYSMEYKTDLSNHWKECECGEKSEMGAHAYDGIKCVCGKYESTYYSEGLIFELVGNEYVVIDYIGADEAVIPATYEGKKVTKIESFNYSPLTSVVIGDNVKTIGASAFEECSSLTTVKMGDRVTNIEANAFYKCSSLKNIEINDSVKSIGASAFGYCALLTNIVIPDSVTSIGKSAFIECNKLERVSIGRGITAISASMFDNCKKLDGVIIPENVNTIGSGAFSECHSLKSIVIPDSVTSIGSQAFNMCKSLEKIELGKYTTSIGSLAFFSCSKLKSLVIPATVTSIGYYLVTDCNALESITFEDADNWYITRDSSAWQKREGGMQTVVDNAENNTKIFRENFYYYWYKK